MTTLRNRFLRRVGAVLACAALAAKTALPGEPALFEVKIDGFDQRTGQVTVTSPRDGIIDHEARLLLCVGSQPMAWATPIELREGQATFACPPEALLPTDIKGLHGWIAQPDLVANLLDRWPTGATLQAEVDSVGPGGRSVWVRAGERQGIAVGNGWWLRLGGQPAARFDVRFVAPELSYCAVLPLVADPPLKAGSRIALWPSPGERRTGRATSAVSYIEEPGGQRLVWVPTPRGVECAAEPHLDFFHDGRYVGHGLVERQDDRFWYAALTGATPAGGIVPPASSNSTSTGPTSDRTASRPAGGAGSPTSAPSALAVGDPVLVRTAADIAQRRFVARVFELTLEGAVVNAGEVDGLAHGQRATVHRAGRELGSVSVTRAQRSYALVVPAGAGDREPLLLQVGDELRFAPPPALPTVVAALVSVNEKDKTLFTARLAVTPPPLSTPLSVRAGGRTLGVAILVTADSSSAGGFVLPCSLTAPLAAGMQLVQEPE